MGKFVISVRKNGGYQFNLKAGNGEVILTSEGYTSKSSCINGIESVKTNSLFDSRFEHKTSADGKYYFNLKAGNGQIIERVKCILKLQEGTPVLLQLKAMQ